MLTWGWSADPNLAGGRERRGEAGEEGNPRRHATGRDVGAEGELCRAFKEEAEAQAAGADRSGGDRQREGSGVLPASTARRFQSHAPLAAGSPCVCVCFFFH